MGATTDPRIVESLICILKNKGAKEIYIVESDTIFRKANEVFEKLGYKDLAQRTNVKLVNLSLEDTVEMEVDGLLWALILGRYHILSSRIGWELERLLISRFSAKS